MAVPREELSNLSGRLTKLVQCDPLLMLGILYAMPAGPWGSIVDQTTFGQLTDDLILRAKPALRAYRLDVSTHVEDVAHEVLLKLGSGKFLKCYHAAHGHPRPYMLGCARNLARVEARSIWRRYRRDGGLPPLPE